MEKTRSPIRPMILVAVLLILLAVCFPIQAKAGKNQIHEFSHSLKKVGNDFELSLKFKGNLIASENITDAALSMGEVPKTQKDYGINIFGVYVKDLTLLTVEYSPKDESHSIRLFYAIGEGPYGIKEMGHQTYYFSVKAQKAVKGEKIAFEIKTANN